MNFNYIPSQEEYLARVAKYFLYARGYNLFGNFVDLNSNRPNEMVQNCQHVDGIMVPTNVRLSLTETIVLKESEIPAVQEEFAIVATAHGWKTGHIDYRIFHPNLCVLSNLWLYHIVDSIERTT